MFRLVLWLVSQVVLHSGLFALPCSRNSGLGLFGHSSHSSLTKRLGVASATHTIATTMMQKVPDGSQKAGLWGMGDPPGRLDTATTP